MSLFSDWLTLYCRKRFTMPHADQYENLYYSFDLGPAHIVSYNTEVFFWPDLFSQQHMRQQYEWLEADLAAANGNRQETPWIIVMGHRPFYCVVAGAAHRCDLEHEASRLVSTAYISSLAQSDMHAISMTAFRHACTVHAHEV